MTHLKLSERIEEAIVDPSKCQVPQDRLQAARAAAASCALRRRRHACSPPGRAPCW